MASNDFGDEFCPEKDDTKEFLRKKERFFDPKSKPTGPVVDFKKELKAQTADRGKKAYSVYEDKLIVDTMRSCAKLNKSINAALEEIVDKLIHRSFDSVKERYKKWIKRFTDADLNKIVDFCKGKERVVLDSFMIKRKIDEKKGTFQLTEIIPIEEGTKFGYNKKFAEDNKADDVIEEEEEESEKSLGLLVGSPRFGIGSEKSLDVTQVLAKLNESAKKNNIQTIGDLDDLLGGTPRKERDLILGKDKRFKPLSAKSNLNSARAKSCKSNRRGRIFSTSFGNIF